MFGWGQHRLVTKSTDGDEFVWFELSSLCGSVRKQPAQPWVSDSGVRRKGQKKNKPRTLLPTSFVPCLTSLHGGRSRGGYGCDREAPLGGAASCLFPLLLPSVGGH